MFIIIQTRQAYFPRTTVHKNVSTTNVSHFLSFKTTHKPSNTADFQFSGVEHINQQNGLGNLESKE